MTTTAATMTGTIKAKRAKAPGLDPSYGFIRATDGTEYFFLPMEVQNREFAECKVGDPVTFEIEQHEKGLRARNIQVMER